MPTEQEWDAQALNCQSCDRPEPREEWEYYLCRFQKRECKEDFNHFLKLTERRIRLHIAHQFQKPLNSTVVEDIYVESGAKLYLKAYKYECQPNSWSWVKVVVKNCGVDYFRYETARTKRIAQPMIDTDGGPDLDLDQFVDTRTPDPYAIAELMELKLRVREAVANLTPDERLLIAMYLDNKTYLEIARTFDVAGSTAFKRLMEIFERTRILMNRYRERSKHCIDLVWRI